MIEALQVEPVNATGDRGPGSISSVTASVIRTQQEFVELAEGWKALFDRSGCDNVYLSYEWMHAWWEQWGSAVSLFLVVVSGPGNRLGALAPFCITTRGGYPFSRRVLGFISSTKACCDHFDILVEPGFERGAARAIVGEILTRRREWTCLEFAHASTDSARLTELLRELKMSGMAEHIAPEALCPFIQLPGSYQEFLADLSGSMRKNLRRYFRSLEQSGPVEVHCLSTPEGIEGAFTELMRLHRLRFEKSARRSSFLDAELQAFHTRVLLPLTMRGWVRIYLLRVSGRAIAALYGFMVRKKFFYYQSGTDPAWLRAGAGAACIAGVIEHCISCGAVEYDFLRGEEEYKRYWTRTTRQDSTFRLFDARIASRLELARLKLIDIARSLKKSLQTGIASGFMRRFVSVRALLARVLRAVISLIKLRKRTGLRATAQWIHFRLRSVLGAHEAPSLRLWPRHVEHPLTARLRGSSDLSVFWEIFVDEPFSSLQDLENVSVIFDLGANVGFSSAYFLSCFPKARVLAVEPDARNAAVCLKNLEPYKDRVLLLHGAVWAECTELCLATKGTAGHPRECATQVATPSAGGVGNIQAWDMESLIDMAGGAQVDLLKIDIEGSELALFRAQAASWLTRVRNLCIELHGEECRNAFLNALAGFDYELEHAGYLTICRNLRRATRLEEPIIPLCKHAGVGAQN